MARSTSSELLPAPPSVRLGGLKNGKFGGTVAIRTVLANDGIKPNMGCPPTTNGDRIAGLAPTKPASAQGQKGIRGRISH